MSNVEGLRKYNSLRYEKLKGDKNGLSSVRINNITMQNNLTANNLKSAYPTHPGTIVRDELRYRGISQRTFAQQIGMSYTVLSEILNARRPVSERTALLFEAALEIDAIPLMKLQIEYNLRRIREEEAFMTRIHRIKQLNNRLQARP